MTDEINRSRRRFMGTATLALAAAQLGKVGTAQAQDREPRELAAIGRSSTWLNSSRLTLADLRGKVVVVNFCTYTCINWLRTVPYVRAWSQKYTQQAVVIGVHTPEFAFEKNVDNVRRAVGQLSIDYPMVIDNDYAIWRAFRNQYWPALYFVDAQGRVRDNHFGEGEYPRSEIAIQRLMAETGIPAVPAGVVSVAGRGIEAEADWDNLRSPETYVGYQRTQNFASPGGADRDRRSAYAAPARLVRNQWALGGEWTIGDKGAVLNKEGGRIAYRFHARDLHLILGPARPGIPARFRLSIDGQPPGAAHGLDTEEGGNGTVVEQRLYQLIRQPTPIIDRTFEIQFLDAGVEAFAFTFG